MQTLRFYSAASATTNARIDRENAILRGVTAMQAGVEAIGHGCQADLTTLYTLATMGNANPKGIRGRFGHPGISENATGKQVQVARSFRVEGDNLLHDSHLLQSARKSPAFSQDPLEYIMDLAEKAPTEFGESVVIEADLVWTLADGTEVSIYGDDDDDGWAPSVNNKRPENALTPLPVIRPAKFWAVDVVNEGALTRNGLFPEMAQMLFAGHSSEFAAEIFRIVDEWRERYNIPLSALPGKVDQVLGSYMALRQKDRIMKKNLRLEQAEEVETEAPIETVVETEPVADPVDDALADAEALAASIRDDQATDLSLATQLQQVVARQEALAAQIERMSRLLVQNLEATATLQRNLQRMNGEPVVTERVPTTAQRPLEPAQYAHPRPGAFAMTQQPVSVAERLGSEATELLNPRAAAMAKQMERNARIGR